MKKLLILPLLVFLTGCVTYYQPEAGLEDGVYYAEDDPSYILNSGDYSGVVYYPWSSLDYFYLGYWSYPSYGFSYGYSFALGYSPWGYPYGYPGYYSPWYFSHYNDPYWRPHQGNCSRRHGCRDNNDDDRDTGEFEYAQGDPESERDADNEEKPGNRYVSGKKNSAGKPYKRYVWTAPNGLYGNRGMDVSKNEITKTGKSRVEPAKTSPAKPQRSASSPADRHARARAGSGPSAYRESGAPSSSHSSPRDHGSSMKGESSRHKDRD